jgi:hypothetical protein
MYLHYFTDDALVEFAQILETAENLAQKQAFFDAIARMLYLLQGSPKRAGGHEGLWYLSDIDTKFANKVFYELIEKYEIQIENDRIWFKQDGLRFPHVGIQSDETGTWVKQDGAWVKLDGIVRIVRVKRDPIPKQQN